MAFNFGSAASTFGQQSAATSKPAFGFGTNTTSSGNIHLHRYFEICLFVNLFNEILNIQ